MTNDFRASNIQTSKIIPSGSGGTSTGAKLVIYPISADETGTPNQGFIDQSIFVTSSIGTDVFLFVSGGIGQKGTAGAQVVAAFGGDVHISGNLTIDGAGGGGGGAAYWFSVTNDVIYATGSVEQGFGNTAISSSSSHAEGFYNIAAGEGSHAEGQFTTSSADHSHSEGESTEAVGYASHSEGFFTVVSGAFAHAEGENSLVVGRAAHGEGWLTTSSGDYSHAEGYLTIASGTYSHAEGIGTVASGSGQLTIGTYNVRGNSFSSFVIGDGTGSLDIERSDIVRVNSGSLPGYGTVQITGSLVVKGGTFSRVIDREVVFEVTMSAERDQVIRVALSSSNTVLKLPNPILSSSFLIKKTDTGTYSIGLSSYAGELIDNNNSPYTLPGSTQIDLPAWQIWSDGVNWWIA